ncbi:MAG: hypothetical protein HY736_26615 [Verrucomicrobia bacterium]|nr:hypothetical protein [Verrucomicrobiota bacterium]
MRTIFRATFAAAAVSTLPAQSNVAPRIDGGSTTALAWRRLAAQSHTTLVGLNQPDRTALPPLPAGVEELTFSEFFGPIGDRGLEYSAKLRALDGRLVRLTGYMVREQEHSPGLFLFAGRPATVETKGLCAVDTAPPTAVHVLLPSDADRRVPYRPGRIVLLGRIELGPRLEVDGRNSTVRLVLDATSAAQFAPASPLPAR